MQSSCPIQLAQRCVPRHLAEAVETAVVGAVAPSWYSGVLVAAAGKGNAALPSPVQVARTYLCVLCPRSDPVSHHSLMKPATLSPETLQ